MKMNKKGMSLGDLYPAVLTLVIIGILLGIGIYTLDQVAEGVASEDITVTNETITLGTTAISVDTADDCQAREFAIVALINATGGEAVLATNYTFSTAGLLTGASGADEFNNTSTKISYTYTGTTATSSTDACEALGTSVTGTGGFASWIAIIVVVLAAAIILGVVLSSFGRNSAA